MSRLRKVDEENRLVIVFYKVETEQSRFYFMNETKDQQDTLKLTFSFSITNGPNFATILCRSTCIEPIC